MGGGYVERIREGNAPPLAGIAGAVVLVAIGAFVYASLGNQNAGIAFVIAAVALALYVLVNSAAAFVVGFAGFAWYVYTIDTSLGKFLFIVLALIFVVALVGFLTNLYH